jgi:chromate reductase
MYKVAVLVGSLSSQSINRSLARALAKLAAPKLELVQVPLDDLPMLNSELQNDPPQSVWAMKKAVDAADAVLFVSPENNRSVPSVLKNAIDWGSRPWGQSSWVNKPGAIIGASPGSTATSAMQQHLRTILSPLQAHIMGQPEAYVQFKPDLIDANDAVTDENVKKLLQTYVDAFAAWIGKMKGAA